MTGTGLLAYIVSRCIPWPPIDDGTDNIHSSKVSNTALEPNLKCQSVSTVKPYPQPQKSIPKRKYARNQILLVFSHLETTKDDDGKLRTNDGRRTTDDGRRGRTTNDGLRRRTTYDGDEEKTNTADDETTGTNDVRTTA